MGSPLGFRYTIQWTNPYGSPPVGKPRVKAEMFESIQHRVERMKQDHQSIPAEFSNLVEPGDGYGVVWQAIPRKLRRYPKETLAKIRQNRLKKRVLQKTPLFADQIYEEEIAKNKEYFEGITREDLVRARDEVVKYEDDLRKRFYEYIKKWEAK